jgi:hypothetical protein
MKKKPKLSKKSILFITDSAVASFVLLSAILLLTSTDVGTGKKRVTATMASDIIDVMGEIRVNEYSTYPLIQSLIADGNITDTNMTMLIQIGTFWAEGKPELAQNLTRLVLKDLITDNMGIEVAIDYEEIYTKNATYLPSSSLSVSSAKRMVSGIQRGAPTQGYNARAYAVSLSKNNTKIVKGDVVYSSVKKPGGGTNSNIVLEIYDLWIPENATIYDAYWFIEAYYTDNKFKAYINGTLIPGSGGTGNVLLTDLESYVHPGYNNLTVDYRFGSNGPEGGDDGASHFVVKYTTPTPTTVTDTNKFYFSKAASNTPIRQKKPIFVDGTINTIDINVNAVGTNATLGFTYRGQWHNISKKNIISESASWSNIEIETAMNAANVTYSMLGSEYFWFVLDIDDYVSEAYMTETRAILPDSKIDIDFDPKINPYGHIDVTQVINNYTYANKESGDFYRNIQWFYTHLPEGIFYNLDAQLAWMFTGDGYPYQKIYSNKIAQYSHPPNPFIQDLARWAVTNTTGTIKTGTNNFSVSVDEEYGFNPFNSLVDFTVLIDGNVPYGITFANQSDAQADAINRLITQLGPYVQAIEIVNTSVVVSDVPSMWGPALFEVRVKQ